MQHHNSLNEISLEGSILSIGSFDGVHLGHQQIIQTLVERADEVDLPSVIVTFHPHPQLVIHAESRPFYLTLPEKRAALLGDLGVDHVLTYPFSLQVSQLSPEDFISGLIEKINFEELWIGYDFALGRDRQGTSSRLGVIGEQKGFSVHEVAPYFLDGELVSSSRIRNALRGGEIRMANQLLGREFALTGEVVRGENRGKGLGFATSNLEVHPELVNIRPGVYACQVNVDGKTYQAVTNIGYRPTFGDDLEAARIETHLLDFSGDLYGRRLELVFFDRLRDEKKFSRVEDLIQQIQKDVENAREILT